MRTLVKAGIALFILSLLLIAIGSSMFQESFSNNLNELGILPGNSTHFSFNLTNYTIVDIFYYTNGVPINYYLLDQQAYSSLGSGVSHWSSALNNASALERNGAIEIIYNSTAGMFPYQQEYPNAGVYLFNGSSILPSGRYYSVFENPTKSNATVYYTLATKSTISISSYIFSAQGISVMFGVCMLLGGIAILLYSILTRPKKPDANIDEEVKALYGRKEYAQGKRRGKSREAKR